MFNYPIARPGIFSRGLSLTKGINWGGLLDGTQKTLGIINQAIPIVYQVKPIFSNAKTIFRIADELRTPDKKSSTSSNSNVTNNSIEYNENRPVFYI